MADLGTSIATTWSPSGGADLDPYFRRITGNLAVAHSVLRRLITQRGSLSWAPSIGFDVRALLNEGIATNSRGPLNVLESLIRTEALGDERVEEASVSAVLQGARRNELLITMTLTTAEGPFRLVLKSTALTLAVLAIET